ncbi:MAG TPA: GtrA family protein [Amnibacterium sp.]|jgi:putative flippase GtrA|nr:GtrA family protein [Amnibacterium sp.]
MRRNRIVGLLKQILAFGTVGGIGFVLDVSVFTLLRETALSPTHVHGGAIIAKIISTTVAIAANWVGNRYWTFGRDRTTNSAVEAIEFAAVSILGMLVGLACLGFSHYVLGLRSVLDDNLSSNVVGLILGSAVRFVLYRSWVYSPRRRRNAPVAEVPAPFTSPIPTV